MNPINRIILYAALAAGIAGCSCKQSEYEFSGKLGEEGVTFQEHCMDDYSRLEVRRADGTELKFIDSYRDGMLDELEMKTTTLFRRYKTSRDNELDKPVIEQAQKQYEQYLEAILKENKKNALDALKKGE